MRSGCVCVCFFLGGEGMSGVTFCALLWSEILLFFGFVYFTERINVSNAY